MVLKEKKEFVMWTHERESSGIAEISYSWASEISLLVNMNFVLCDSLQ